MKLQMQAQSLRVRVDEAELARLLGGETLSLRTCCAGKMLFALDLGLGDRLALVPGANWQLTLADTELRDYVDTLPRRAALSLELVQGEDAPLRIDFEVDVRDSVQVRGAKRRR